MSENEFQELDNGLTQFLNLYNERVTEQNAAQVIAEFKEEWSAIAGCFVDQTLIWPSKYGVALYTYALALFSLSSLNEDKIQNLLKLIDAFAEKEGTKHKFEINKSLYGVLGSCWHKLGEGYDKQAINAYKRFIYYLLASSAPTIYSPSAYGFFKCNNRLYQNLINEQIGVSSPITFNDPFDCPVITLLNKGDDVALLLRRAFCEGLKIACFTSNIKLPYLVDPNDMYATPIYNKKKYRGNKKEYLNYLMWAHYAEQHKGVCIKYKFNVDNSKTDSSNVNIISAFKDVKYSDKALQTLSNTSSISMQDAFTLKGKQWEYENEMRYLYFDVNGKGEHNVVSVPNCIESIYFGLRCSSMDIESIIRIMHKKLFVKKNINGQLVKKEPIVFFRIVSNEKKFGELKAVRIKKDEIKKILSK